MFKYYINTFSCSMCIIGTVVVVIVW